MGRKAKKRKVKSNSMSYVNTSIQYMPSGTVIFAYSDLFLPTHGRFKADSHTACRAHAVPLQCRAAKGLECVFPI